MQHATAVELGENDFEFVIHTPQQVYTFRAASKKLRDQWYRGISGMAAFFQSESWDIQSSAVFESKSVEVHESVVAWPSTPFSQAVHVATFPFKLLLYFTIPDVRHKSGEKYYLLTFLMSVVWLAAIAYVCSLG